MSHDPERLGLLGRLLRLQYRGGLRPVRTDQPEEPVIVPPAMPETRSSTFEEATERVRKATDGLLILSALTINPADPAQLNAGIDLAMRRLSEDVHQ